MKPADQQRILRAVADATSLSPAKIIDTTSRQALHIAARWAYWAALRHMGASLMEIAILSNASHTSVIHACTRYLEDPLILATVVDPLARGYPVTYNQLVNAYAVSCGKAEPFSGFSLSPDWCLRPVSILGKHVNGYLDDKGVIHPFGMVFESEIAAKQAVYLHATKCLTSIGIKL